MYRAFIPTLDSTTLRAGMVALVCSTVVASANAAGEANLWDGYYLQSKSKNVELRVQPFNTTSIANAGKVRGRDCLFYDWPQLNQIKALSASSVETVFVKPSIRKFGARIYQAELTDVDFGNFEGPVRRYCWDTNATDYLPKGRETDGGSQYQVSPRLAPHKVYVLYVNQVGVIDVFRLTK